MKVASFLRSPPLNRSIASGPHKIPAPEKALLAVRLPASLTIMSGGRPRQRMARHARGSIAFSESAESNKRNF
jgi:hypothetical protein